jgi:hypothetical protein
MIPRLFPQRFPEKKKEIVMPRLFPHRFPSYNVAIIYKIQGKYEGALEMHTKSLDIKTRILGGD